MAGSRKQLLIALSVLILLMITEGIRGFSRRRYDRPIWGQVEKKSRPEDNRPLEDPSPSRLSFGNHGQSETLQYPSGSPSRNNREAQIKIIFPDRDMESEGPSVPACEGTTFCEEVSGYPMDIVNRVIKKDRKIQDYQNTDVTDTISQRMGVATTESLCISEERVVYPKSAESRNKEWLFILNHPNYTQGVRIETCLNEGTACRIVDGFADGYTTTCQQKYIYRQLTALKSDGSTSRDFFRFPASCCCHVEFTGPESRFGRENDFSLPEMSTLLRTP